MNINISLTPEQIEDVIVQEMKYCIVNVLNTNNYYEFTLEERDKFLDSCMEILEYYSVDTDFQAFLKKINFTKPTSMQS